MSAPRVIHTAQALVDEVVEVKALPDRGGNAVATSHQRYAGGAVTILLAAARSGAECVHAGGVGTGSNADLIRSVLAADGVAVAAPPVAGLDSGVCFVMVEPSGERTFVTTQGAERQITLESLQTSRPRRGDLVCVSGYSLFGSTRGPLLSWLEGLDPGVIVVMDPGAAFASLPADLLERALAVTDVWTGNAQEAQDLTGVGPIEHSVLKVASRSSAAAAVIVRDGPRGCVVSADGEVHVVPGYPQEPIDTNGAGDTHTGVLLAGRAAGLDWVTAATRANAAGAIKVTRRGPTTAPTADEIDALLAARVS